MGMECSTHGAKRNTCWILVGKSRRKRTTKNISDVDGVIILKCILEEYDEGLLNLSTEAKLLLLLLLI
jgi:hypothetical protein